jgi:hypothetical protein
MNLYKVMGGVAVTGALCFALAASIDQHAHGVKGVFGGIGWFGFLASVLALILLTLVALGRSVFRKTTTA